MPSAKLRGVAADVAAAAGCEALVRAVPEVDILVNNAGIFEPKDFFAIPDDDWTRFLEINVMSGVRLSRAYMQGMLKRDWGRIVFISSESGLQIPPEMIHYGVTKTAQLGLSRGLAELTAGTGVTVNAVLPGPTRSEGVETFLRQMADREGADVETMARNFVKRTGRPLCCSGSPPSRRWPTWWLYRFAASVGHQRRSPAGRWRRRACHRLTHAKA